MAAPGGMDTGDVRVLSVLYNNLGERHREYGEALQFMDEATWPDSPIKGPQTCLWALRFMKTHGGTPVGWHQKWRSLCRLQESDGGVSMHESFCRTLELLVTFDQLNPAALAAGEYCARQIQLIEERWKDRATGAPDQAAASQDAHIYSGLGTRGCISPKLQEWVAGELRKESAVMTERRKAREERSLAKPKS